MTIKIADDQFFLETLFFVFRQQIEDQNPIQTEAKIGDTKVKLSITPISIKKYSSERREVNFTCRFGRLPGTGIALIEEAKVLQTHKIIVTSSTNAQLIIETNPMPANEFKVLHGGPCITFLM